MKNVKFEIKGDSLIITVNLKERHGLSSSAKTVTIASTEGNQRVGRSDITMGLTVYTKEGLEAEKAKAEKVREAAAKATEGDATAAA
jgi:hypothetical protein